MSSQEKELSKAIEKQTVAICTQMHLEFSALIGALKPKQEASIEELAIDVIDIFEDFLDEKEIYIVNPEKVQSECPTNIYGTDYGKLSDQIEDAISRWRDKH